MILYQPCSFDISELGVCEEDYVDDEDDAKGEKKEDDDEEKENDKEQVDRSLFS